MKHGIMVHNVTGAVSVMQPAPNARQGVESEDNYMRRTNGKVLKGGEHVHAHDAEIKPGYVPMREHRNAWYVDKLDGKIKVDLPTAHALQKHRLFLKWQQCKRLIDETLEFATGFGDTVAINLLESEKTRVAAMPGQIKTELDRMLADGDEGALGHFEPTWPDLKATGFGEAQVDLSAFKLPEPKPERV